MSLEVTSEFTTRDYLVDVAWELYQFVADSPLYDFSDDGQTCRASLAFLDEDGVVRQANRCFEFIGYGGPNLRVVVNNLEAVCSSDFMQDMQSRRKSRADWENECF